MVGGKGLPEAFACSAASWVGLLGGQSSCIPLRVKPACCEAGQPSVLPLPQVDKIKQLRARCKAIGANPWIEVDGGVTPENAWKVIEAGANAIVSGSGVFGAKDYAAGEAGFLALPGFSFGWPFAPGRGQPRRVWRQGLRGGWGRGRGRASSLLWLGF
jgi:hypothetical protein